MLIAVALAYILLCVSIHVRLEASWINAQGSATFSVGVLGVYLHRDFVMTAHACSVQVQTRYGRIEKGKPRNTSHRIQSWLVHAVRSRRFEQVAFNLRLGLGDACATAVAVGAVNMLARTLLASVHDYRLCDVHIIPDFTKICLCANLQGTISYRLGDVILAVIKRMYRKKGWK